MALGKWLVEFPNLYNWFPSFARRLNGRRLERWAVVATSELRNGGSTESHVQGFYCF
jgi:hypothetical protein